MPEPEALGLAEEAAPTFGSWDQPREPHPPVHRWAERVLPEALSPATGHHWELTGDADNRLVGIKTHHGHRTRPYRHLSKTGRKPPTSNRWGKSVRSHAPFTLNFIPLWYLTGFILRPVLYVFKIPRENRHISKCPVTGVRGVSLLKDQNPVIRGGNRSSER